MPKIIDENWKALAVALLSVIGSFATFYLTIGRDVVTRDETIALIKTHAPYAEDRKLIHSKLATVEETNGKLSDAINGLTNELAKLRAVNEMLMSDRKK